MKKTPEALAQGQLDAYNARDLEKFCAFFHANVIAYRLADNSVAVNGMQEFKARYKELFDGSPKLNCQLKNRMTFGNYVIDHELIRGHGFYKDGTQIAAIYYVENDLISKIWFAV